MLCGSRRNRNSFDPQVITDQTSGVWNKAVSLRACFGLGIAVGLVLRPKLSVVILSGAVIFNISLSLVILSIAGGT